MSRYRPVAIDRASYASTPPAPRQSPSAEHQAADSDRFRFLRDKIAELALEQGHYAGVPMPLDGEKLVIHPSYEFAGALGQRFGEGNKPTDASGRVLRNHWYSHRKRCVVGIVEEGGKRWAAEVPAFHHVSFDLTTLGCSDAWGLDQEFKAIDLLGSLVSARKMRQYMLTGMFLETSKRSGVSYMFRRLKPTVAMKDVKGEMKILCCLCMHPIAYYEGSWAGAMVPTDDIIAHLQLMRSDEHMFWRRCAQHPAYRPEAGL